MLMKQAVIKHPNCFLVLFHGNLNQRRSNVTPLSYSDINFSHAFTDHHYGLVIHKTLRIYKY